MLRYSKLSTGEDKVTENNKFPMENRKLDYSGPFRSDGRHKPL